MPGPRILDNPVQELDRLIHEIVDQWVFQQVTIDGAPVRVMCTIPIKFVPTPEEMRVYEIEQTEIRPLAKRRIAPRYPDALKRNKIEGSVNIIFVVDEQGDVLQPRAEWASHEEFNPTSIESIRQWKFSPGYIDGKAVKVRVSAPWCFVSSNTIPRVYALVAGHPTSLGISHSQLVSSLLAVSLSCGVPFESTLKPPERTVQSNLSNHLW